jgi:hypothetical protein
MNARRAGRTYDPRTPVGFRLCKSQNETLAWEQGGADVAGVITLELNEVNFDLVERYTDDLKLDNFRRLLERYRRYRTEAERDYEHVEPWIQWVTVHTGMDLSRHGIFRLGDIVEHDYEQIWEKIERELGLTVAAVSPMNAKTSVEHSPFFIPDPWTGTEVRGSWDLRALHRAAKQAVNDNAEGAVGLRSLLDLVAGAARNVPIAELPGYVRLAAKSLGRKWLRAGVLDKLLTDTFVTQWQRHRPAYSSLFLNAAAHVQHHYMYNSPYYDGGHRNPEWYVAPDVDPLEDIYRVYDSILGRIFGLVDRNDLRLLVLTGLSQVANPEIVHYYRPCDHAGVMRTLGLEGMTAVEPRMSRDFLVTFTSPATAATGAEVLRSVKAEDGTAVFDVDLRADNIFVKVAYTHEMTRGMSASLNGRVIPDFDSQFVHVSIENAIHTTYGTFIDCGEPPATDVATIPLTNLFDHTFSVVKRTCA